MSELYEVPPQPPGGKFVVDKRVGVGRLHFDLYHIRASGQRVFIADVTGKRIKGLKMREEDVKALLDWWMS